MDKQLFWKEAKGSNGNVIEDLEDLVRTLCEIYVCVGSMY